MAATAALLLMAVAAAAPCPAGDPVQWIADWCMLTLETDDEIAASDCIGHESKIEYQSACAAKQHYKRLLCERLVAAGTRKGSVADCVADPAFKGRVVESGGAGN